MEDPGKRERLRNGEAVELKPGIWGRLNKNNRTLELDSGKILPIGQADQRDLFPENERSLDVARRTEKIEKQVKEAPFGEFFHQLGQKGIFNAPKDWLDYFTKTGDQYLKQKEAEGRVSARISEESPYTSGAATVASFAPDIALTHGMSAMKAAPLLTGLHAGSRIASEPEEVAKEALVSAGAGKLIDIGGNALNKIAQRRGEVRALPGQQQAAREANQLQTEQYNLLRQNVSDVNQARLKQHETDVLNRKNKMIADENAYKQQKAANDAIVIQLKNDAALAKAQRSANAAKMQADYQAKKATTDLENKRLENEFKASQKQYQESLKQIPEMQKQAQKEFSENVVRNAKRIEKLFPEKSRISTDQFGIAEFVDQNIAKSGIAGSTEARQASRLLNSLFPEGELMGGREIAKRYKALEDAIVNSKPEVQKVLNDFKVHLGERLPGVAEDTIAFHRILPNLRKTIDSDIRKILSQMGLGKEFEPVFKKATANANAYLKSGMLPKDFIAKMQSGELSREITNKIIKPEDFLGEIAPHNIQYMKKLDTLKYFYEEGDRRFAFFTSELMKNLDEKLARYEIKAMKGAEKAGKRVARRVEKTQGLAEPITPPEPPIAPNALPLPTKPSPLPPVPPVQLPAPPVAPAVPPLPNKPNLTPMPTPPNPIPSPTLAPAQGLAERMGDFLEQPILGKGKGIANNPLLQLGGLKYLLGKAAIPAEAAYLGMRGLTSPTQAGQIARLSFKQGGIRAIDMWAQDYPSYRNGILENPQDRRSLAKEIEDDPEIPIEQKAIMQSKVNRGKPLQGNL